MLEVEGLGNVCKEGTFFIHLQISPSSEFSYRGGQDLKQHAQLLLYYLGNP